MTPVLDLRVTRMSSCGGMHVAYSAAMPGGRIDRGAWARAVQRLILRFDPGPRGDGNKSAFARRIGMTTRTIERWIGQVHEVKIETVRSVIDALHLSPQESAELLAEIGFHLATRPQRPDPREDPVIRQILDDPRWSEEERTELVQSQLDRIEADALRRQDEYDRYLRLRQGHRDAS